MTNAKLLEKLYGIAEMLPPQGKERFELCRKGSGTIKTYEQFADSLAVRLASLVIDVETDLKLEAAKSSGKLDRYKACSRILKRAMSDSREALHGAWIASGMQCICDSYVLVRLKDHLDLEKLPDCFVAVNVERIVPKDKNLGGSVLDLPSIEELRGYIKIEKARLKSLKDESGVTWDFGKDLPSVNAQFLLDVLEIFPDAVAVASKTRPLLGAIYFSSSDGDCILLPVRKAEVKK